MSYIGRLGIGVHGAERAGFWDADQLFDLKHDPDERVNLAPDPRHAATLQRMRAMLTADLRVNGRPFGEFIPGGNPAPPGQIDAQIAQVKKLIIQGKTVIVPTEDDPEKTSVSSGSVEAGRAQEKEEGVTCPHPLIPSHPNYPCKDTCPSCF